MSKIKDKEFNEILESFNGLIENIHDLEAISDETSQFNVFEAAGLKSQEIKHSHFLAFLLDPFASHGLGDVFIKRFLTKVVLDNGSSNKKDATAADIVCANWNSADVRREYKNIDIFIENSDEKIIVAIENKVFASEHGDQLKKYRKWCEDNYSDEYEKIFIFLTPYGSEPSDDNYLTCSYEVICDLLETINNSYKNRISDDVCIAIEHYLKLVRRHVLEQDELKEKAHKLYKKYQSAFDYIASNIPNNDDEIVNIMKSCIAENSDKLRIVKGNKLLLCFPTEWDDVPELMTGTNQDWKEPMLVDIEILYERDAVNVMVYLGNGEKEYRERINNHISAFSDREQKPLNRKYNKLYNKKLLEASIVQDGDLDIIESEYRKNWNEFIEGDFQKIVKEVKQLFAA